MKTSLNLDDLLFAAASKEARKNGRTVSETISYWARLGWETVKDRSAKKTKSQPKTVDLGGPANISINSRRDWLDILDK